MALPISPPVAPMLAKVVRELPMGEGLFYEPKWDGFRCIVFRDEEMVELGSRNERPLTRYFPELLEPLRQNLPHRCVIDGEIVVVGPAGLDFDALTQRIHPAPSRVRLLSTTTPASFVAFDVLALGDDDLRALGYEQRRRRLEAALADATAPVHLTPVTTDPVVAADWFSRFEGAGLDGLVVKPATLTYRPGQRAMWKVKHERSADCVVGGFRWHSQRGDGQVVGSLLLGLYDAQGRLHHVGVASGFSAARRKELTTLLHPYLADAAAFEEHPWNTATLEEDLARGVGGPASRVPGAASRWSAGKDLRWVPLRPELVVEVAYDHLQGSRFRHATSLRRFRPDRSPRSCTYAQLETPVPAELGALFGTG